MCLYVCVCVCGQGTAEKLVQHLVLHSPAADPTYVDDFLLTYRTFLKSACDITAQLMQWLDDPAHADKVLHHESVSYTHLTLPTILRV